MPLSSSTDDALLDGVHPWWPNASPVWQDNSRPGRRLIDYLEPKVHSTLKQRTWKTIVIAGAYTRDGKNIASLSENPHREFNWQRPTAEVIDEDTIQLNCFPTISYVIHYASLVSTYFATQGLRSPLNVETLLPQADALQNLLRHSNLVDMGDADIVVIGYLDTFPTGMGGRSQAPMDTHVRSEGQMFGWHKWKTSHGYTVVYLGCAAALWGESVACLMEILRSLCKIKCVLYVGRVGSLDPKLVPNETLAIGGQCHVNGETVRFQNVLSACASKSPLVHTGNLVTVVSPLCENQEWLQQWAEDYCWVDCETGYIAQAAAKSGIDFGYLHIVSDNLGHQYSENLANEEDTSIQGKRQSLFETITWIIDAFLADYECSPELQDLSKP